MPPTPSPYEIALASAAPRVKLGDRVEVELIAESGEAEQMAFDMGVIAVISLAGHRA